MIAFLALQFLQKLWVFISIISDLTNVQITSFSSTSGVKVEPLGSMNDRFMKQRKKMVGKQCGAKEQRNLIPRHSMA